MSPLEVIAVSLTIIKSFQRILTMLSANICFILCPKSEAAVAELAL